MLDPKAREAIDAYEVYRDQRKSHYDEVAKDRDFVLGNQWTDDEASELTARGHAPLVINRIQPVIMQEIAIMTANNVEFRVLAREDGDVRVAKIGNDLLTYIQDRNNFQLAFSNIIYDFLVPGCGYGYVYEDNYSFDGAEVGIDHLPFDDVFPDPYARRVDLYDAENIIVSKKITEGQFLRLFPDMKSALTRAESDFTGNVNASTGLYNQNKIRQPKDIYDPKRKLYRIIYRYSMSKIPKVRVVDSNGSVTLYKPERWEEVRQKPAVREALALEALKARDVWDDQSYVEVSLGGTVLTDKVELKSRRIPIIPFMNFHTGTPYAIGDVRPLKGIQKEINKRRSLLIAHATTSTASKLLVEKGSVDNIEEIERKNARPGSVIEYNPGYQVPTQSMPVPLPNGLFQLEAEAKYDLEYGAGMFAISQGSTRDAPETFRATLAIEEFANRRLNLKMRNITNSLSIMGNVVWEFMQKIYDYDKVVRITTSDGDERQIKLGLVSDPKEAELKKIFDITTGTYDVKAVGGSTMASNRWAELQEYKELLQIGAIDQVEFLKKTDIFDREGILERKGQIQQLSGQLEQVMGMLEESQKLAKSKDSKIQSLIQQLVKAQLTIKEMNKTQKAETAKEGE